MMKTDLDQLGGFLVYAGFALLLASGGLSLIVLSLGYVFRCH